MYRRSRAHCTRPPCSSFKRAFSAPVPQVALGFEGRRTALCRRQEPADSCFFIIFRSPSSLASRLRARSTQRRAPWLARHSIWPAGVTQFLSVLCVRLYLSAAVRSALGSREAWARSTLRAKSGRSATCRSRGLSFPWRARERPPEAECQSTLKRSKKIMAFCRFALSLSLAPSSLSPPLEPDFSMAGVEVPFFVLSLLPARS